MTNQCSKQVPGLSGLSGMSFFHHDNRGPSGTIYLTGQYGYPRNLNCKHVVQADSSCEEITIKYLNVAVAVSDNCGNDNFRFGWPEEDSFKVTERRCSCFGNGCFGFGREPDNHLLGPDTFSIKSNTFTLYFESDNNHTRNTGGLVFQWQCVRKRTTTTTITTTTTTRRSTTPATTTAT